MLEWLLVSMCVMSDFKQNACGKATDAYVEGNPLIRASERKLDRMYVKPLPEELKFVGGAVGTLYNRQVKFTLYRGLILDIRDAGKESRLGYVFTF